MGHIRQTIIQEMARITKAGLSTPGVTRRKASFWDRRSTTKNSKMKATGHMMTISPKAMAKT